jgi:hypothetical protein
MKVPQTGEAVESERIEGGIVFTEGCCGDACKNMAGVEAVPRRNMLGAKAGFTRSEYLLFTDLAFSLSPRGRCVFSTGLVLYRRRSYDTSPRSNKYSVTTNSVA